MDIWAIADLHLSFGTPGKSMGIFGPNWENHHEKIAANWKHAVHPDDIVLIPGDISWAMSFSGAKADLEWINALPGTKVISKGNHDYWWPSNQKLTEGLPPSFQFVNKNALKIGKVAIGGTRLWDSDEYTFEGFIQWREVRNTKEITPEELGKKKKENHRIFENELKRLAFSLDQLDDECSVRIAMVHYPPIGPDLLPSHASKILEAYEIDYCLFGHLHNVIEGLLPFGEKNGVSYLLTSCDYLDFVPKKILSI